MLGEDPLVTTWSHAAEAGWHGDVLANEIRLEPKIFSESAKGDHISGFRRGRYLHANIHCEVFLSSEKIQYQIAAAIPKERALVRLSSFRLTAPAALRSALSLPAGTTP